MELLQKLENILLGWVKNVPHLPAGVRRWLGENLWWIVLVSVILSGIWLLIAVFGILGTLALLGSVGSDYLLDQSQVNWSLVTGGVALAFSVVSLVVSILAIKPLQARVKKGWVLLFIVWLINVLALVVGAIISLNPFTFIFSIIFGALFAAISGYLLFEVHSQFAHTTKQATAPVTTPKA